MLKNIFNLNLDRDNNYYFGLTLLLVSILSIFWYLKFDLFEPLSFLITFLISGWGFVLLWKSDNDLRFEMAKNRIDELEVRLGYNSMFSSRRTLSLKYNKRSTK